MAERTSGDTVETARRDALKEKLLTAKAAKKIREGGAGEHSTAARRVTSTQDEASISLPFRGKTRNIDFLWASVALW